MTSRPLSSDDRDAPFLTPPSASGRLHVSLADGPAAARRFVRSALPRWAGPGAVYDVELLVSELVTNAIRHAGADAVAVGVVSSPNSVQIGVHDGLDRPPVLAAGERRGPGGYGVRIVDHLADRWGVVSGPSGKTVWFEFDAHPAIGEAGPTGPEVGPADGV